MPFESYNANSTLQLSSESLVISLITSGTATTTNPNIATINRSSFTIAYTVQGNAPMIAIAPADFCALQESVIRSGVLYQTFYSELPAGATVPYWVFDSVPSAPSLGYGLELYNAATQRTYSVAKKPLRIAGWLTADANLGTFTYVAGRSYAVVFSQYSIKSFFEQVDVYNPTIPYSADMYYRGNITTSVKGIYAGFQSMDRLTDFDALTGSTSGYGPANRGSEMLVVDVTDYGGSVPNSPLTPSNLTISPRYQLIRDTEDYTFAPVTVGVPAGTPYSYVWTIRGFGEGTLANWTIAAGQGTASAQISIHLRTFPSGGQILQADAICEVTYSNGTKSREGTSFFYVYNYYSGGGGPPAGGAGGITISPTGANDSGPSGSHNFGTFTATASGGSASSYTWSAGGSAGNFSISSPSSASTGVSVSGVLSGDTATADLTCSAVINGTQYSATATINYSRSDANCVEIGSFMPDGRTAGEVEVNDVIEVLDYSTMEGTTTEEVTAVLTATAECVRITSQSGITLVASTTTPITLRDGSTPHITEAVGKELAVRDQAGFRWEKIITLEYVGVRTVRKISCHEATYAAGEHPDRFIFTHNIKNVAQQLN